MSEPEPLDRRRFLQDSVRVAGVLTLGTGLGFLAGARGRATETRWQIDPDKCVGCGKCATNCVLDESAVRCVQCFDMCGYCDICTGYLATQYQNVDTAAENQLCPTGALVRTLIEEKAGQRFYEYTIQVAECIGCGVCVKGCALMNGSLYLQVMHDLCKNCNECAIAVSCPSRAFDRIPRETPYRVKRQALTLLCQKAGDPANTPARELLAQVYQP
jgi:Na+-translocating ferredoxin:NAD+ oxidoreductase subunit B